MKGATVHYHGHRPTGMLKVQVCRGQNLTPQIGLGIPGSLVSTVTWDPTKFLDEKSRKKLADFEKGIYHAGETESSSVTFNPEWKSMHGSDQLERLKQLLPSTNFLSRTNLDDTSMSEKINIQSESRETLELPILQPISELTRQAGTKSDSEIEEDSADGIELLPWEASKGAIVVQVRFTDVLSKLQIFDQILGEVVIPFDKIVKEKVDGWFQVLPKGTLETIEENPSEKPEKSDKKSFLTRLTDPDNESVEEDKIQDQLPLIYLKADFVPPSDNVTDIDRETSIVVAEHMIWSTNETKDSSGFIGSSLKKFNTVRGVTGQVQYLQNQLGNILDKIEILRNAFNFTVRISIVYHPSIHVT